MSQIRAMIIQTFNPAPITKKKFNHQALVVRVHLLNIVRHHQKISAAIGNL